MYDDEMNSGYSSGNQTTGIFSGAQGNVEPQITEQNAIERNTIEQSNTEWNATQVTGNSTTQQYSTYQTENNDGCTGYFNRIDAVQNDQHQQERYQGETVQPVKSRKSEEESKNNKAGGFFRKALVSISLGLFFGLFAGLGFYIVQLGFGVTEQASNNDTISENRIDSLPVAEDDKDITLTNANSITVVESDVSAVVEEVMPAMVSIINNYTEVGSFFGQTYTQDQASSGSGIIVAENDTELLIVTNYHVIADADRLEVIFIDGNTAEAKVKGTDADMDLAVIAIALETISEETMNAISVATLGDSDALKLGEPVIAIGNALGYGQSVTNGIVSALNRELTLSDGSTGTFVQTNAAINPGNSGGALLNIKGEVIGINSNKIGGDAIEGMGYAIPISSASPIIADLMERHTRDKVAEGETGYLGISLQEVTSQISQMYNMPVGIFVASIEEDSAAEKAGLMKGDIITRFDGEKITSYTDLQEILQYYAAGDTAQITLMRQERGEYVEYEYEVTLGRRPESAR